MYCKFCGGTIDDDCVVCPKCGKQVGVLTGQQPQVVINNSNTNTNTAYARASANGYGRGRMRNKWVSLFLCIFLGYLGAHKFYEGKSGTGVLYLCTVGLCGIGWIVDIVTLAMKPNPYYVQRG